MIDRLFSFIAPFDCVICKREGSALCDWCRPDAFAPLPSRCYRCHALTDDSAVCRACRRHSPLKYAWVATEYDQVAKRLLRKYKFERASALSSLLADVLDEVAPYLPADTVVTYVPTATSRVRGRGYDHAARLARDFAGKRGLECVSLLYRQGQTRQVGAKRDQRLAQLQNAFWPRNPSRINNSNILLIDDIVTTGATVESTAKTLKQAGAKQVNALLFAQKQ